MTQKEITRFRVINQTIDKVLTIREAAELLGLSERQVIRLKKGVAKEGPAFIIHKNRGRKPKHTIPNEIRNLIIELKQSKYEEANFSHFQELIEEHEQIQVSYPTIYRILTNEGIKSPKKHRKRKTHHRRKRKPQRGMLVQIDASPHEWIIGEESFDLHGAIDDATGEILALFFTPNECMEGYFEIMRQIIANHGIPTSLYCDRHTIFVSPNEDKLSIEDQLNGKIANLTQFGRAMQELGINIIKAYSAQAKGRVERLWGTLQSRLPVEFKIHGITSMEAANAFLAQFIKSFNKKFAVEPENPESAFRELDPSIDLDHILCIKRTRTIIEGSAFSYGGQYYQLIKNGKKATAMPKAKLTVLDSPKIGVKAIYADVVYDTKILDERPKKAVTNPPNVNTDTGEINPAYIFVAVLSASSYPFVYAYDNIKLPNWMDAHVKAYEYFDGVPKITISDNTKTAVITPDIVDPVLNKTYNEMARHYETTLVPARAGRPKDKAADENMVGTTFVCNKV